MASVRTPRKKTSTGCWTCRSRRVKCDEQLPFCQRCKLFGVECEGYGVRLTWLFSDGEGQFQHDANTPTVDTQFVRTRRSMRVFENLEAWITPQYSEPELDAMLERIDKCPTHSSGRERGLFSVFPMQRVSSPSQSNLIICESSSVQDPEEDIDDPENIDVSVTRETTNTIDSPAARNIPSQQPVCLKHNLTPVSGVPGSRQSIIEDTDSASSNVAHQNGPCQSHTPSLLQTALSLPPKPARHLDSLQTPSHEKRLIHHWVTFTSGKLVLVDEPHNPCRSMMLPMALQGIMLSPDDSTADVAVFHAICAGAAYNLYELGGRANEQDRALAWKHDEQAIHHLRHNLAQPDQHHTKSLAMAIMACITVEAISGTTGRWRTHLDGGIAYLTELRKTAIGLQISLAFQVHLIPMAILCGYPVPVELKSFLNDDAEKLEFSFPYYGISQSLLRNLDRINAFAAAASDRNVPQSDLDRFELQLYLDFPPNPDDPNPKTHTAIVHYMTQAFYYALLVHYQRAIRHSPLEEVQALVEKGIAQLELIEQATQDTAGSVMMWAPLVLGAACCGPALQRRMSAWFQKKRRLGMRNVAVIEDMIKDLWDKRARGDVDVDWQHLIAQEEFNVFRL